MRRTQFSDPIRRGIVEELATTSNDDCTGILNVLKAGEQPVAMHLGLAGPRTSPYGFQPMIKRWLASLRA